MAADKYIYNNSGRLTEKAAVQTGGGGNAGKIPALNDATGLLDLSMMPTGIGPEVFVTVCSEALAAGAFVNLFLDGGVCKARNANAAAAGKEADGFVLAASASPGDPCTVYFQGLNNVLSGMTLGAKQYLSAAVAGARTETPPSGSGNVVQWLGKAYSAIAMHFAQNEGFVLA